MELVVIFLCLAAFGSAADVSQVQTSYPEGNQILFDSKGYLVNKISFIHVKWTMDMEPALQLLVNITTDLEVRFKSEMAKSNIPVKKFTVKQNITSVWDDNTLAELYSERSLDGAMVSLTLLEMFYRIFNQLNNLLRSVPEKYDISEDSLVHRRVKRELLDLIPAEHMDVINFFPTEVHHPSIYDYSPESFSLSNQTHYTNETHLNREKRELLGGMALAGVAWNAFKINTIENHLANLSSKYNYLVDVVQLQSSQFSQLAADVVLMKRLIHIISSNNYRKILATSISASDRLRDTVDSVVSIITSGRQRRVSPRLINGDALAELFINLQKKAKDLNSELLLLHPTDIYDVQASYGYSQEGLLFKIYAHVPLASKSELLALFEHMPFPLSYQSILANSTITPDTGVDKYLAVLPDTSSPDGHRYRVLNEPEIQSCFRLRDYYLCSGRNTLRTDIFSSCIGSLWLKKDNLIIENCKMKVEPLQEVAVKLSPRQWLVFSPVPESYSINCGKSIIKSLRFESQTLVSLIEDCDVELKSHHLSTDVNVLVDFKVDSFEWRFYGNVLSIKSDPVNDDPNRAIDEATLARELYALQNISHLKHHFESSYDPFSDIWKAITNLNLFSWFGNVYTFILIVVLIYLFYQALVRGWFQKCFCPKRNRYQETSIVRPIRTPIIRYSSASRTNDEIELPSPPSYTSIVDEKAPSAPLLDPDSVMAVVDGPCVVKHDSNQKPEDFVCHNHDPVHGCSGSFRKKGKKSRK